MKKLKRTIVALLLVFAMIVCPFSAIGQPSIVQAATVKINKSEITITKGKTYQLKISGTKKKITWKTFDKSVASVNSKGKVSAKGIGSTVVYGKIGGKYYHCVVNVIEKYKKSTMEKNVSYKKYTVNGDTLLFYTNKNDYAVYVNATETYYKNGKIVDFVENSSYVMKKSKIIIPIITPTDSSYNQIKYDDSTIEYEVSKLSGTFYDDKISFTTSNGLNDCLIVGAKNNSNKTLTFFFFQVVFFDKEGNVVGYGDEGINSFKKGSTKNFKVYYPEGTNFSSYKICIYNANDF